MAWNASVHVRRKLRLLLLLFSYRLELQPVVCAPPAAVAAMRSWRTPQPQLQLLPPPLRLNQQLLPLHPNHAHVRVDVDADAAVAAAAARVRCRRILLQPQPQPRRVPPPLRLLRLPQLSHQGDAVDVVAAEDAVVVEVVEVAGAAEGLEAADAVPKGPS